MCRLTSKISALLEKNPFLLVVVGVLGVSLSSIFVRLSDAPTIVIACCRLLWTVLLMTPFVWSRASFRKELLSLPFRQILLSITSGIFLAIHFALWFESLKQTSVASSTAIVCTEVVWVAIGYGMFLKGKVTLRAIICIAIALVGSLVIAFSDSGQSGSHLYGDLLSLLAAISVAVYTLLGKSARTTMSASAYTYLVYCACALCLVAWASLQYTVKDFAFDAIQAGFLLAVFSTLMGHSIFSWCLKYFSPTFLSASRLCEPVIAAIFATFLFHEIPDILQITGGLIVLTGVYLYSKEEQQ